MNGRLNVFGFFPTGDGIEPLDVPQLPLIVPWFAVWSMVNVRGSEPVVVTSYDTGNVPFPVHSPDKLAVNVPSPPPW